MITDNRSVRIHRFREEDVLPALREAFSQRPDWRGFSPHQLSVLLWLHSYLTEAPDEIEVENALALALADKEPAA